MKRFFASVVLSILSVVVLTQPVLATDRPISARTQYMNSYQMITGSNELIKSPVYIKSPAGWMSYNQGWTIYNNSVNDGNDKDIEFNLTKNFSSDNFEKRYCVTARDLAPFGVTAKLQLWTGEYTIVPGYPVGLETNPHDFVPTTPLNNQFNKVCTSWTTIKDAPTATNQRLAIVNDVVVTQGAVQISAVSIESR